jgi:hypothetical protein
MISAWIFIISLQTFLGGTLIVRVERETPELCERARKFFAVQLDNHQFSGQISQCALGTATVVPPK